MSEQTFHSLRRQGKPFVRYGLLRDVSGFEYFRFWSANEFPEKLWKQSFHGHAILDSTVATIALREHHILRKPTLHCALVEIDPALHDYANSHNVAEREYAGNAVVRLAIENYLDGGLKSSPEAIRQWAEIQCDPDLSAERMRTAVTASKVFIYEHRAAKLGTQGFEDISPGWG